MVAEGLLDHGLAAELAHDERLRGLPLAEAGDADALRQVAQRMVERMVDIVRGDLDVEANAVFSEFGDLGLHARGRHARDPGAVL